MKVLYVDDSEGCAAPELDKEIKSSQPDAQVFVPIGSQDSPCPTPHPRPWPVTQPDLHPPARAQPITFTTASFAATKFGSTKMKKGVGPQVGWWPAGVQAARSPHSSSLALARSPTNNLLSRRASLCPCIH